MSQKDREPYILDSGKLDDVMLALVSTAFLMYEAPFDEEILADFQLALDIVAEQELGVLTLETSQKLKDLLKKIRAV
jgi:hypothetical protein